VIAAIRAPETQAERPTPPAQTGLTPMRSDSCAPTGHREPLTFRRAPLLAAALCFALGDYLAQSPPHFRPAILLLAATTALVALTVLTLRRAERLTLLPLLALWIAAGLWCAEIEPGPPSQAALQQNADGLSRTLRGHILRIRQLPAHSTAPALTPDADDSEWGSSERDDADTEAPPILSFDLAVDALEDVTPDLSRMLPQTGGVRITVLGNTPAPTLRCGDILELPVRLRTPDRFRDPGAWQLADYLAAQGIGAQASVPASRITIVHQANHPALQSLHCTLTAAQTWAAARLTTFVASPANRRLPKPLRLTLDDAGILNAMLFGDRDRLTHSLRLGFERTGSFHLFVVSGLHVALLAAAVFWITRRLRLNNLLATCTTLVLTTAYALLTGFGAPVQRALLMASIFLLARLFLRGHNTLNALGAAVLGVLLLSPRSLFESGFQMTFLAILAIAGIARPLAERTFLPYARAAANLDALWIDPVLLPHLAQLRVMLRLWGEHLQHLLGRPARHLPGLFIRVTLGILDLALIGLVAELVMTLPMAVYFHRATLFALPANMFSIPLVALLAPLAVLTFLLTLVNAWLAMLPAAATALLLHAITAAIARIGHLRAADWRIPAPPLVIILIALLAWAFCIWAVRRPHRRWPLTAAALLPLIAILILWPYAPIRAPGTLEVTAIDVGQGDSLLVVDPTGQTMLIDAGGPVGRTGSSALSPDAEPDAFDIGEEVVSPTLWSRRLRRLDLVVLTHAHSDHMGGMPAILRNFRPRELWVGIDPASAAYDALLQQAATLGITVRHLHAGNAFAWGGTRVNVLAPASSYRNPNAPTNDDSLVLRLDYGHSSVLLEGDAEAPSERAMLAAGAQTPTAQTPGTQTPAELRPVTLLKVGHHGSRTSTTPGFLAALNPQDAVISVGRHNTFGHPRPEVLARLAANHTRTYRTDRFGLVRFLLTPDGKITESEAQPASAWGW
jgi:competence protein ComEC